MYNGYKVKVVYCDEFKAVLPWPYKFICNSSFVILT